MEERAIREIWRQNDIDDWDTTPIPMAAIMEARRRNLIDIPPFCDLCCIRLGSTSCTHCPHFREMLYIRRTRV